MARFLYSAFSDEAADSIDGQIAACKANGVTHMELRGVDGKNISEFSVDEAKSLKEKLDANGMKVSSIGSYYGKIEITDDFEPHFEGFKNTVEVAKTLEAKYIRLFSFYFTKGESYEEYRSEVMRRVRAMAEYSKERGVLCCHENERGIYGDIPERCLDLHRELGDVIGGIFDPANFILNGVEILPAYDLLEPYITYMHVKDAIGAEETVVPAGQGDAHFDELIRRFNKKDGERFLSVEPHLKVFDALKTIERDDSLSLKMDKFTYPDNNASFAAAVGGIKEVVARVKTLRYGIIGIGNMGSAHLGYYLDGLIPEMVLTAIADIDPAKLERTEKKCRERSCEIKYFDSAEALIDSGEVDAVIVATPHYSHPPIVEYGLTHGVHVLGEKPAGVYTKRVREMNEVAAKSDKVFALMFNQRTNPMYIKLREIVQSGEYGGLHRFNWIITDWYRTQAYYNSGGWRATWSGEGGGVLLNQCPHQLDLWQWITGMPESIQAQCSIGKWHNIEVEDDVTIYAEYKNGATGVFITTTGDAPGTNRLEITLDRAKLVCENDSIRVYILDESMTEFSRTAEEGFAKPGGHWEDIDYVDTDTEQHVAVTNAFAAHILHGTPLIARGEEGINGLTISNAAHLSSWLGRKITLPIDEDLFYKELQKKIALSCGKKEPVKEVVVEDMSSTYGS